MTAALKIQAAVTETPLLASADPVIGFLTQRQLLVAAAGIELCVAAVALFSNRPRLALTALVWISLLFGSYRCGLYLVHATGGCKCFGILTIWYRGHAESFKWIARALLAYLSVPAILFTARKGRFTRSLPVTAIFLCLGSHGTLHAQAAGGTLEFEVNGEISWLNGNRNVLQGGGRTSAFTVALKGERWYIRLAPINWPERKSPQGGGVPTPLATEIASDGTNTFRIKRYSPEDLHLSQVAERWPGATPMDRGSDRELYALWYAFASSSYCASLTNESLLPLQPGTPSVTGRIETETAYPQLPRSIVTTNQDSTVRSELRVRAFTNVSGLSIPAEGIVNYFLGGGGASPWSYVKFVSLSINPECSVTNFRLEISAPQALVYDSTYRHANPPHVLRFETNQWPTAQEVKAKYDKLAMVEKAGQPRSRWPMMIVVAVFAVGPFFFLLYYITTKKCLRKP